MKSCVALALVSFAASAQAMAAEALPLRSGYYVQRDTPCDKASNATITLYDGASFGTAHSECQKAVVRKLSDQAYELTQKCRDMQGQGGSWETSKSNYSVQSRTEFVETTRYGTFAFRFCERSSLPDPWKSNDLSRHGIR